MNVKWITINCAAALCSLFMLTALAAGGYGPEDVVHQYFSALKEGDIPGLKSVMSDAYYTKRKTLLERNAGYADFLVENYRDVQIAVLDVNIADDKAYVTVEKVHAADGREEIVMILIKTDDWAWKIDRERYR
jgi:hypothetical protein